MWALPTLRHHLERSCMPHSSKQIKSDDSAPHSNASSLDNAWNAALYEDAHSFVWKQATSLVDLLAPRAGERILDVGCGTGHLTAQIAAAGADVIGIDSSAEMIEQARRNFPAIRFELADARDFAFAEPFDAVFSNAVLHWILEPGRVVRRVREALKPGGRFVAEFGGRGNVRLIADALTHACAIVGTAMPERLWYFPSIAEYGAVLDAQGLELTSALPVDRPTPPEGADGMRRWLEMFAEPALSGVLDERRETLLVCVATGLRPALCRDGIWHADYRRLRIVARRTADV